MIIIKVCSLLIFKLKNLSDNVKIGLFMSEFNLWHEIWLLKLFDSYLQKTPQLLGHSQECQF